MNDLYDYCRILDIRVKCNIRAIALYLAKIGHDLESMSSDGHTCTDKRGNVVCKYNILNPCSYEYAANLGSTRLAPEDEEFAKLLADTEKLYIRYKQAQGAEAYTNFKTEFTITGGYYNSTLKRYLTEALNEYGYSECVHFDMTFEPIPHAKSYIFRIRIDLKDTGLV